MCRTGCPTQDHSGWGACARSAGIQIDRAGLSGARDVNRDGERRLTRYAQARKDGLQPKNTQWENVRAAEESGGVAPTVVQQAVA